MNTHERELIAVLHSVDVRLAVIESQVSGIPERLRDLEKWRERVIGITLGLGALSGIVGSLVVWAITGYFK